jgi:hypothetical protein
MSTSLEDLFTNRASGKSHHGGSGHHVEPQSRMWPVGSIPIAPSSQIRHHRGVTPGSDAEGNTSSR